MFQALDIAPAPAPHQWVGGETHRYLGRQYRLSISGGSPKVVLAGGHFRVSTPTRSPGLVRSQLERWYRAHALDIFERRGQALIDKAARLGLKELPPVRVRRFVKRWGSCSPNGNLYLNIDAVKLPVGCIDYLLVHELCHLRVPNHGRRFWRLLESCMPDWEKWRDRLVRAEI